ncbi:mammalian cell entry protein [Williamsia sp. Leaf354]|jgi:phospholipid/cholesterol/gamma-HCH transport system substrate-binding protein|uniref:MCE family protein n=1 Tax=Williamsia sp. Leaf354 TaxID=1736349 RepID=UPI0006FBB79C|nr:MCE family protein [Williamsia sp. Leaf354]KQR98170.1 mammalian cell entry protein [Williamsia sp. Leaf354]
MVSRFQVRQIIVLVVVATLFGVVLAVKYARIDNLVGVGIYTVNADFRDSGGIFTNAEVTYQGVPVGRVGSLQLRPDGVRVALNLDSGGPKVPATAQAVVANRSAIGEQYVDLRPSSVGGPYLKDGSVISDTSIPTPVQDVLASAVDFTDSVPLSDLNTVITELGKAFNGNGENLRVLVDSLANLSKSGNDNLPATISLIRNSDTVLSTQADQSDAILDWSKNLGLVTAQLATSDPDLRRLLTTGQTSATQIAALIERSGGDLTSVLRNLATDVRNIRGTFPLVGPAINMLSSLSSGSYSTAPGDGTIRFGTVLETNNPPDCTVGYEGTQAIIAAEKRKNPNFDIDYDDFAFNRDARCAVAQGNPTDVRGAQNARFADPGVAQPWDRIPKKDPDKLNLNPLATQLSYLLGVTSR